MVQPEEVQQIQLGQAVAGNVKKASNLPDEEAKEEKAEASGVTPSPSTALASLSNLRLDQESGLTEIFDGMASSGAQPSEPSVAHGNRKSTRLRGLHLTAHPSPAIPAPSSPRNDPYSHSLDDPELLAPPFPFTPASCPSDTKTVGNRFYSRSHPPHPRSSQSSTSQGSDEPLAARVAALEKHLKTIRSTLYNTMERFDRLNSVEARENTPFHNSS
jgi:hypothetical protein